MRLGFPLTAAVCCALVGTSAFADDPQKDGVAAPAVEKVDAAPKKDVAASGGEKVDGAPAVEEVPAPKEEPVIVPERPLSDTSRATEEVKKLAPNDSDAALDRALGLDKQNEPAPEPDGLGVQLIKTMFMLAVVVGMIYLTLNFGLRKLMGLKGTPLGGAGGVVSIIERIPLEQRRTMFVVRAAGEYLLIGTSEGGMTTLAKLDSAEVERIQRERGSAHAQLSPFFQKLLSGQKKSGPPPQA